MTPEKISNGGKKLFDIGIMLMCLGKAQGCDKYDWLIDYLRGEHPFVKRPISANAPTKLKS